MINSCAQTEKSVKFITFKSFISLNGKMLPAQGKHLLYTINLLKQSKEIKRSLTCISIRLAKNKEPLGNIPPSMQR